MRLRPTDSTTPIAHHEAEDALARAALHAGHTVIVDRTNRTRAHRERWLQIARETSRSAIAVVMTTAEPLCREGNAKRNSGRLSEERMDRMFAAPRARQRRRRFRIHPPRGRRGTGDRLGRASFATDASRNDPEPAPTIRIDGLAMKASELALAYAMDLVAAARLDDAANFLPSRVTALAIVTAARLHEADAGKSWRIWRRDGCLHASPNAGQTEAAMAGALGVRLGGMNTYDGLRHSAPLLCAEGRAPGPSPCLTRSCAPAIKARVEPDSGLQRIPARL